MPNQLTDSWMMFLSILCILAISIYIGRIAIKIFQYEKQVDRGWDDLIRRADEIVSRLKNAIATIDSLQEDVKTAPKKVKKSAQKIKTLKTKLK